MAYIKFKCPKCAQPLEAPRELAQETITCPVCQANIQVPDALARHDRPMIPMYYNRWLVMAKRAYLLYIALVLAFFLIPFSNDFAFLIPSEPSHTPMNKTWAAWMSYGFEDAHSKEIDEHAQKVVEYVRVNASNEYIDHTRELQYRLGSQYFEAEHLKHNLTKLYIDFIPFFLRRNALGLGVILALPLLGYLALCWIWSAVRITPGWPR